MRTDSGVKVPQPSQEPGPSTVRKALKASQLPAGIGAVVGISAAMKTPASSAIGKFALVLAVAAIIGIIFGIVAFVCVYGYLKLRGR